MAGLRVDKSERGFTWILCDSYLEENRHHERLVSESSAIGEDNLGKPGSSFLWIGRYHHLNREQVAQLVGHLQGWLATGNLEEEN